MQHRQFSQEGNSVGLLIRRWAVRQENRDSITGEGKGIFRLCVHFELGAHRFPYTPDQTGSGVMPRGLLFPAPKHKKKVVTHPQGIPSFIPACTTGGTICFDFQQRQKFFYAATSIPALVTTHTNFHPFNTGDPLSTSKRTVADRLLPSSAKV